MQICIVGTGYVGLVTGACFAEFGIYVNCVDKDADKIRSLKKGITPFFEPGLEDLVKSALNQGRLNFTTELSAAVGNSLVIFIAVGTPPRGDGSANLRYVEEVAKEIATHIKNYTVIATKSTVPVGTGDKIRNIVSKNLKEGSDFDIVSNPEFLRQGSAIEDFMRPNRVVIGARSNRAIDIMKDLYRPLYLIETPFVITNIETAEMIKYASNSFLATKISFINELAILCEKVGADINVVAKGMGLDGRIGSKFLHAGPGFGGSCLPKDTKALIQIAKEHNLNLEIIQAVIKVNDRQPSFAIDKIQKVFNTIEGRVFAILGLSFKPNTDDLRGSPSIKIIKSLLQKGSRIRAYDPASMNNARAVLPEITYCTDAYDAAKGADAVVIATEWNQFRNLDLKRLINLLKEPYFFDLRNIYDPLKMKSLGFKYFSLGRL